MERKVDVVTRDGLENIRVKKAAEDIRRTVIHTSCREYAKIEEPLDPGSSPG